MMNKIKSPSFGWAPDGFAFSDKSGGFCDDLVTTFKQKITNFVKHLFSVQESEEAKKLREERLAQYESKKAKSG